jgi:hypothetical protein
MPPSLLDWVPEDHLVWTILGSVEELDLGAFYADYRADGHGRPAYDPAMMVGAQLRSEGHHLCRAAADRAPHPPARPAGRAVARLAALRLDHQP